MKILPGNDHPIARDGEGFVTCCGPAPAASGAAAAGCGSGWRGQRRDTAPCVPSLGHPPRLWAESPAQRDPPCSQPGSAPSPSPAHPSPRPASAGARRATGGSPARCWGAGRHRSGRGGCGNTWLGCHEWSGEAEQGRTITSPSSARAAPDRFVQQVCPSQCARGELEGPAGHRTHGVRSVEISASFRRQGFSPWTLRMLFLRGRKGSCRELSTRRNPEGTSKGGRNRHHGAGSVWPGCDRVCDRVCGRKGQGRDALCCAEAVFGGPELERLQSARILQLMQKANHRLVPPRRGRGRAPRALHSCIPPTPSSEAPPRAGGAPAPHPPARREAPRHRGGCGRCRRASGTWREQVRGPVRLPAALWQQWGPSP